jgi:hypothetical protein
MGLLQGAITFDPWERIWKTWAPNKCCFFLWQVRAPQFTAPGQMPIMRPGGQDHSTFAGQMCFCTPVLICFAAAVQTPRNHPGTLKEGLNTCRETIRWKPCGQTHKENRGQLDWARQRVESCPHQKPHVVRRSGGLSRDQGNNSLCGRQSSPGRHTGWSVGRA